MSRSLLQWMLGLLLCSGGWLAQAQTTVEYIHTDALGSVVAVTNEAGQVIERFDYEPYGAIIGQPNYGGIGFTGHVQDAATGLTYMQERYYDPQMGRFLSVDPVTAYDGNVRHFSRYTYAYNNPYSFTDPDGRAPNQAGVTGPLHVYSSLQNGSLADLRDSHGGNTSRYFYTEKFGWVDIRHFAEAARMVSEGTSGSTVRALGVGNEVHQWATEWGEDYRSGFSPEDLPSNDAGINFAEGLREGESLASGFFRWAKNNGAAINPTSPSTGYGNLPATDPSSNGGANRGNSNTTSAPAGREIPVVRVEGRIDSMHLSREDRNK